MLCADMAKKQKHNKKSKQGQPSFKHRRALYDYFNVDTTDVGIVLEGS